MLDKRLVNQIKEDFPKGTRVILRAMKEEERPRPGTRGTVTFVDDAGTIHVSWESGGNLGLIPGVDVFEVLTAKALLGELIKEDACSIFQAQELTKLLHEEGRLPKNYKIQILVREHELALIDKNYLEANSLNAFFPVGKIRNLENALDELKKQRELGI